MRLDATSSRRTYCVAKQACKPVVPVGQANQQHLDARPTSRSTVALMPS